MIPVMKWYERLLAWFLIRIESRSGWGGGFSDEKDGMRWLNSGDHMLYGSVCGLMRDYMIIRLAREYPKEQE